MDLSKHRIDWTDVLVSMEKSGWKVNKYGDVERVYHCPENEIHIFQYFDNPQLLRVIVDTEFYSAQLMLPLVLIEKAAFNI